MSTKTRDLSVQWVPCEKCNYFYCICLDDQDARRAPADDELVNQLAASVAILESSDKAWLRRVIHLAEGRIMEIEDRGKP